MPNRILPALIGTAEKRELLLQKRIDFTKRQPFVGRVTNCHNYEGDVGVGWFLLSPGGGRPARRLLGGLVLGLHACTCVCVGARASSQCARAAPPLCSAQRRPAAAPPHPRPPLHTRLLAKLISPKRLPTAHQG